MRKGPQEKESAVLQTQTEALLQDESDALHRADTQTVLPGLDAEGRRKTTWTVRLEILEGMKRRILPSQLKCVSTHKRAIKSDALLAVARAIMNTPFHKLGKGKLNRPLLENVKDLERTHSAGKARHEGLSLNTPPHQSLDEGVVPNEDAINWRQWHGKGGIWKAMELHDIPTSKRWIRRAVTSLRDAWWRGTEEACRKALKDCQTLTYRSPEDRTPPATISLKDPSDTA
jgi:hypothetical protein